MRKAAILNKEEKKIKLFHQIQRTKKFIRFKFVSGDEQINNYN
jgi:hypothetical protein